MATTSEEYHAGLNKTDEQSGTWVDAAGAFTGGVLDALGYGTKQEAVQEKPNLTPWLIGGGVVAAGILLLVLTKK